MSNTSAHMAHKPRLISEKKVHEQVIKVNNIDYTILISVVLLVLIGIVMVFSSSYFVASTSIKYNYDMYYLVKRQAGFAVLGFIAMLFMANFNYRYLKRLAFPAYIISIALLIATALFGVKVNGARRWIEIFGIQFQPSEMAKIAVVLLMARMISGKKNLLKTIPGTCIPAMFIVVCAAIIGVGTNNWSSAILILIIGFGMIFVASPYTAIYVIAGGLAVAGLVAVLATSAGTVRGGRFEAWLDPFSDPLGKGFQVIQSLYAVASGGMFGLGLGQSRQKLGFIPEAHNDIIFAIICEELGLVGAGLVLFLFGVLVWRTVKVAINAYDLFGSMIATGIGLMIGGQAIINVAVVTNSIPNTGVPLPFISYGGTSLAILLFCMGILLNISRYSKA